MQPARGLTSRQAENDRAGASLFGLTIPNICDEVTEVDSLTLAPTLNFNCSALRHGEGWLLAYRSDDIPRRRGWRHHAQVSVRLTELDAAFQPISGGRKIELPPLYVDKPGFMRHEDPRLFEHDGDVYLTFSTHSSVLKTASVGLTNLRTGELWWIPYGRNRQRDGQPLAPMMEATSAGFEKNWMFFSIGSALYLLYSIQPHVVLRIEHGQPVEEFVTRPQFTWGLGEPRGGTPPVRISETEFLSFFHSHVRLRRQRFYVCGAYTFDAFPPFHVRRISHEPIMYPDPNGAYLANVVFPGSADLKDGKWTMFYGHNNCSCRVAIFDHERLLSSMVPVTSQADHCGIHSPQSQEVKIHSEELTPA